MANSVKYTTISVLRKDKKKLDFLRADEGGSLSVLLGRLIGEEYDKRFVKGEVAYASTEEGSGAVVVMGGEGS
jgi:hypothetical protein